MRLRITPVKGRQLHAPVSVELSAHGVADDRRARAPVQAASAASAASERTESSIA